MGGYKKGLQTPSRPGAWAHAVRNRQAAPPATNGGGGAAAPTHATQPVRWQQARTGAPMAWMAAAGGPTNATPARSHASVRAGEDGGGGATVSGVCRRRVGAAVRTGCGPAPGDVQHTWRLQICTRQHDHASPHQQRRRSQTESRSQGAPRWRPRAPPPAQVRVAAAGKCASGSGPRQASAQLAAARRVSPPHPKMRLQEPTAGAHLQDAVPPQVAVARGGRTHAVRLVRQGHVLRRGAARCRRARGSSQGTQRCESAGSPLPTHPARTA